VRIEEELKRKRADLIVEVEQLTLRIETVKKQVSAIDQVIAIYDPAHQASISSEAESEAGQSGSLRGSGSACRPWRAKASRGLHRGCAQSFLTYSLAPTTTVGLIPSDAPANGLTKSLVLRWDAEWRPHVFTALEYQRQTLQDLSILRIITVNLIEDIDAARSEWLAATVNVWLGHGIGVFGTIGGATSEVFKGRGQGEPVS
jgi:hypothetical protein